MKDQILNWQRINFFLGIFLALLVFILNPFDLSSDANKIISVALLMVVWWITESLPMSVVALVPLVLIPLLKTETIEEVSKSYSNPVIFLFMGGFMIGLAIEKWELHKRIALHIVKHTGTSGNRIILGFIISTAFISMWLSNTATTMMMFPIAMSVIIVMNQQKQLNANSPNFSISLMLVIAYASNLGGMATIIGTPPNVAFIAFIEKKYNFTLQFFDWMIICGPLVILLLILLYFILCKLLFPNNIKKSEETTAFINSEINALGKLTSAQKRVMIIFLCTVFLWISRELINSFNIVKLDDNLIAVMGALALFITPNGMADGEMILEWKDTSRMAWGILLLFGGGLALAGALEKVGVLNQIGNFLAGFSHVNTFILIVLVVFISIFLSELMSNVAQVIVMAPVLAALADALSINPLLLGLPMTLAASAASMMPMGTPPNAIVFGSGFIKLRDMVKAGLIINLVSILLISLFCWYILPLVIKFVH